MPNSEHPLRKARLAANLTQAEAGRRWGRAQTGVTRLEREPVEAVRLGTLASYIASLGGTVTVTVTVDDVEIVFDPTEPIDDACRKA